MSWDTKRTFVFVVGQRWASALRYDGGAINPLKCEVGRQIYHNSAKKSPSHFVWEQAAPCVAQSGSKSAQHSTALNRGRSRINCGGEPDRECVGYVKRCTTHNVTNGVFRSSFTLPNIRKMVCAALLHSPNSTTTNGVFRFPAYTLPNTRKHNYASLRRQTH